MIEREEQVAELAKEIYKARFGKYPFCGRDKCYECKFNKTAGDGYSCYDYQVAYYLVYQKGYKQTNQTDTVLTAEEHKAFLKDLLTAQKATAERVRTETAREILGQFGSCDNDEARYKLWCDLCELYGMEVEE